MRSRFSPSTAIRSFFVGVLLALAWNGALIASSVPSGGGLTFPILAPNGTAAAPSYSWSADTSIGFYRAGVGDVRFTSGGATVSNTTYYEGAVNGGFTGIGVSTAAGFEKLRVAANAGTGGIYCDGQILSGLGLDSALQSFGGVTINSGGRFVFSSSSNISAPADGSFLLQDSTHGSFTEMQFGGTTAAFPEIRRNGTGIDFRLANNSAYAPITANSLNTTLIQGIGTTVTIAPTASTVIASVSSHAFVAGYPVRRVVGNATLNTSDHLLVIDASGGNATVTLLDTMTATGQEYIVKKIDSTANTVTVTRAGGDTIDGQTTYVLSTQNQTVTIAADGTNSIWYVE